MKKILLLIVLLIVGQMHKALAVISVTQASGGTNICANSAVGGSTPGFTSLGTITVSEGVNADISTGNPRVLVINAPAGWQFNTAVAPTLNFTAGRNIVFMNSGGFTATSLTINVFLFATSQIDVFTIAGLQVQATSAGAAAGNITASTSAGFNGITSGVTSFGALSLTPALIPSVAIAASPSASVCAGTTVSFTATPVNGGTPTWQWQLNGTPVPGATTTTYSNGTLADGNTVSVIMGATGCVTPTFATDNITVTINPLPAAVPVSGAGVYCNSGTITAGPSSGGTIYYQGTDINGTSTLTSSVSENITNTGSFTYYFRELSTAGCWGAPGSAKVLINQPPSALAVTPPSASFCIGDSATLVATATAPDVEVLEEDFNAGIGSWTITNISGTTATFWQPATPPAHAAATAGDGTPYVQSAPDAGAPGLTTTTLLTSPSFSLMGYTSATLTFNQYYRFWGTDIGVAVEYSIDGGGSWLPIFDQVGADVGVSGWSPAIPTTTVALPAGVLNQPNVQLRWNYNTVYGYYWTVDNIKVNATPTLTYDWLAATPSELSCSTCDTVTVTPAMAGANVYTVSSTVSGCTAATTVTLTVNPLPTAFNVTGGGNYCAGGTGVAVGLDSSEGGVDYQLYNGVSTVGAPMAGTGAALDFGLQTAAGTYTVMAANTTTTCMAPMNDSAVIVIDPLPAAITGTTDVCVGSMVTLASATPAGTWSSSDITIATADTFSGDVTGVMAGTADITYTLPTTCFVTQTVTVNALPVIAPITGVTNLCVGGATTLANATAGGVWSTADTAIADIDAGGNVAAIAAGITTISYMVTDGMGCSDTVTAADTVTAYPVVPAIAGPSSVCLGSTITLTNTMMGGIWSSTDMAVGTIDAASGDLTGIAAGTTDISYEITVYPGCTSWAATTETVNPLPVVDFITGDTNVCAGLTMMLANMTMGGIWSSSDAAIATISSSGVVTGVAFGAATITYTYTDTNTCTNFETYAITIGNAMPAVTVLPASASVTLCHGNPVNLVSTGGTGLTYQWNMAGTAIAGATDASYIASVAGMYDLTVDNGTCQMTLPSKTVVNAPDAGITYNSTGNYLYTGTFPTYQWFMDGAAVAGATNGIYSAPAPGTYYVVVADINGCTDTSAEYTVLPSAGVAGADITVGVRVYPNPASTSIHIDAPVPVTVTVVAPDGRTVIANAATNTVNVSQLANGMYMLLIYDTHNTLLKTERFSKIN